jgi:hypothetical protein
MDYPKIVINWDDLQKHSKDIEQDYDMLVTRSYGKDFDDEDQLDLEVYKILYDALKSKPIEFPEIKLTIVFVEFRKRNDLFKELLYQYDITYREDY